MRREKSGLIGCLLASVLVLGCGGKQVPDSEMAGDSEAREMPRSVCTMSTPQVVDGGRPVIHVACRSFDLTLAGYRSGQRYLRDLISAGADWTVITDQAIRSTVEFRSYMDPYNVWQWRDHVTDAEALAACRLMLADLSAGVRVNWEPDARVYLARVRQAMPGVQPGSSAGRPHVGQPGVAGSGPARPSPGGGDTAGPPRGKPKRGTDITWVLPGIRDLQRRLRQTGRDRQLADQMEELLQRAEDQLGAITAGQITSRLTINERITYRELLRRPSVDLTQREVELIHELRTKGGIQDPLRPGSPAHKAYDWDRYKKSGRSWTYERWIKTYHPNITRASDAHAQADHLWKQLGWGKREVTMRLDGGTRVLDIGDTVNSRAMEVKKGYVSLRPDIARQIKLDAELVKRRDWDVTWHVDGRLSKSVRQSLRAARIKIIETKPNMPTRKKRK